MKIASHEVDELFLQLMEIVKNQE